MTRLFDMGTFSVIINLMAKLKLSDGSMQLTPAGYYDGYDGIFDLQLMQGRIESLVAGSKGRLMEALRQVEKASILILGSATTKNINNATRLAHYLRGKAKVSGDTINVIDANDYSVQIHDAAVKALDAHGNWSGRSIRETSQDAFPYPQFKVEKADMRALPHESNSQDVVVSDYTVNYVDSLEDIKNTFKEVRRVLKNEGLYFMTIRYNPEQESTESTDDQGIKKLQGGVQINKFRLDSYLRLAEEAGLERIEMETPFSKESDDVLILFRSKSG